MTQTRFGARRRDVVLAAAAALSAALFGCVAAPGTLERPQVELVSLALREASLDAQRFRVGLSVRNPNAVAIPVEEISFSVRLGAGGLLDGRSVAPFTLDPGAARTVELDVDSDLVSSVSRLLALLAGPNDSISYDLDGLVILSRGIDRTLPFSYRGQVPLSVPAR